MRLFSMTFKDIFDLKHLVKTAYRQLDVILGSLMFLIKEVKHFKRSTFCAVGRLVVPLLLLNSQ
jgi:hypothetical protein